MAETIGSSVEKFSGDLEKGSKVLDVGCGMRPYERFFEHCKYIGVDVEASGRTEAGKKPDRYYDGVNLPYGDQEFDAVICTQVLEHCIDPDRLFGEFYRVLKNDGRLFLTVPFMWGEHEIPYDFRRYSSYGIQRLVSEKGFKMEHFGKLTQGISAIETLVVSEIGNYISNVKKIQQRGFFSRLAEKVFERIVRYLWRAQLKLWRRLYVFDRIYLDNLVIASKTGS